MPRQWCFLWCFNLNQWEAQRARAGSHARVAVGQRKKFSLWPLRRAVKEFSNKIPSPVSGTRVFSHSFDEKNALIFNKTGKRTSLNLFYAERTRKTYTLYYLIYTSLYIQTAEGETMKTIARPRTKMNREC